MAATFGKTCSRSVLEWQYDRAVLCQHSSASPIYKRIANLQAQAKRELTDAEQSKGDTELEQLNALRPLRAILPARLVSPELVRLLVALELPGQGSLASPFSQLLSPHHWR